MKILNISIGFLVAILLFSCSQDENDKTFSTIYEISLGDDLANIMYNKTSFTKIGDDQYVEKGPKHKGKLNNYEIYELSEIEINNLEGNILLYVKNDKVEKIEFLSSQVFLGATGSAGFLFNEFYNEREKWVQNAMSYYDISEWQESDNLKSYSKTDIAHQYEITKVEMMGIQMGWELKYSIISEPAIANDLQTEKDNLRF